MTYESWIQQLLAAPRYRFPAPYAAVRVAGPDARDFLHRMCSQDILGLGDGQVAPAAFLDGKGRILALCHAVPIGETIWLSTQADIAADLAAMLERYHFSERLEVTWAADLTCGEVLSPQPLDPAPDPGPTDGVVVAGVRHGVHWRRCHAPETFFAAGGGNPDGLPELEPAVAECLRIASGEPWLGRDTEPNTLALELPIEDHISLTKGCYTGQEIVARIHTYGHTNRLLVPLHIAGTGAIAKDTPLVELEDGDPVGRVMTSAELPGEDARLAFGILATAACEPDTVLALGDVSGPPVRMLAALPTG